MYPYPEGTDFTALEAQAPRYLSSDADADIEEDEQEAAADCRGERS